jgi:hypothetical protein
VCGFVRDAPRRAYESAQSERSAVLHRLSADFHAGDWTQLFS